jgi:hypothetical protein
MPTTSFPKSSFIGFNAEQFREHVAMAQPEFTSEVLMDLSLHVAKVVRAEWVKLAHQRLDTSLDAYLRSLSEPQVSKHAFDTFSVIELAPAKADRWVLWVENGNAGPWDMRDVLIPEGKEYARIRFGHKPTTGAGRAQAFGHFEAKRDRGRLVGSVTLLAKVLGREAGRLRGRDRLDVAKVESAYTHGNVQHPGQHRIAGFQLPALTNKPDHPITNPFGTYRHKTSIYENLRRTQQRSRKRSFSGGQYETFRTVSRTAGDPHSWMYPKMSGEHLGKDAAKIIRQTAAKYVADVIFGQKQVRRSEVVKAKALKSTKRFR